MEPSPTQSELASNFAPAFARISILFVAFIIEFLIFTFAVDLVPAKPWYILELKYSPILASSSNNQAHTTGGIKFTFFEVCDEVVAFIFMLSPEIFESSTSTLDKPSLK